MHADELTGYLKRDWRINPAQVMVADRVYVCPSERWFFTEYAEALRVFFSEMKLGGWIAERNDCDDFARWSAALAQRLHAVTPPDAARNIPKKAGIAIGEFWYCRNGNPEDEHAIVIGVTPGELTKIKPIFIEPQTRARVELTDAERISCTALRF